MDLIKDALQDKRVLDDWKSYRIRNQFDVNLKDFLNKDYRCKEEKCNNYTLIIYANSSFELIGIYYKEKLVYARLLSIKGELCCSYKYGSFADILFFEISTHYPIYEHELYKKYSYIINGNTSEVINSDTIYMKKFSFIEE